MGEPMRETRAMAFVDPAGAETIERFADPCVGDAFQEMYHFWMQVEAVGPDWIVVREYGDGAPRSFPSHDEFRKAYAYNSIPGYWVRFDKNRPVGLKWRAARPSPGDPTP